MRTSPGVSAIVRAFAMLLFFASVGAGQPTFTGQGLIWSAYGGGGPVAVDSAGEVYLAESIIDAPTCGATATDALYLTKLDASARTILRRTFMGCGA